MPSLAQIAANRLNAQKSTGPKTPEGKAAVRFNALSHGLTARAAVLPGEDPNELHQICERLLASWEDEHQRFLLEQMAVIQLQMARLRRLEVELIVEYEEQPVSDYKITSLDRISRIAARLERHYLKCAAELRQLRKNPQPPQKTPNQTQSRPEPAPPAAPDTPESPSPAAPGQKAQNQTQFPVSGIPQPITHNYNPPQDPVPGAPHPSPGPRANCESDAQCGKCGQKTAS
jgi:hypothetical protein